MPALLCIIATLALSPVPGDADAPPPSVFTIDNACGIFSLWGASQASGLETELFDLEKTLPMDGQYKSMLDLREAATRCGIPTEAVKWSSSRVPSIDRPCIVRIISPEAEHLTHFVVLLASTPHAVLMYNPPFGPVWMSRDWFERRRADRLGLFVGAASPSAGAVQSDPLGLGAAVSVAGAAALLAVALMGLWLLWNPAAETVPAGPCWIGLLSLSTIALSFWLPDFRSPQPSAFGPTLAVSGDPVITASTPSGGQPSEATFGLANVGSAPVVIALVDAGCECASATVEPSHIIDPGAEATLRVVLRNENPVEPSSAPIVVTLELMEPAIPKYLQSAGRASPALNERLRSLTGGRG